MSLLLPDAGLLFWMLLAFGIVFFILYKYGFPVITGMIEERKRFIDDSLRNAKEANEKLANIKQESEAILKAAYDEQTRILREAAQMREQIINEACAKAGDEGEKMLAEVRTLIQHEKENAVREIRAQVAELSISIAEKVIRKELSTDVQQQEYTRKLVDEAVDAQDKEK